MSVTTNHITGSGFLNLTVLGDSYVYQRNAKVRHINITFHGIPGRTINRMISAL